MACRSCGLGPSRSIPVMKKKTLETVTTKSKPTKGLVTSTKKTSIPTRSPAKTFTTVGDP